ncbi:hypothetical protein [Photobacterium sp. DNB22_13_2]
MLSKGLTSKVEAIIATGLPGGYKVLLFLALQYFFGIGVLGHIASWFSIAQILSYFSAIGWCTLILVRVPKLSNEKDRVTEFNKLALMSFTLLSIIITGMLLVGKFMNLSSETSSIIFLLVGWSTYQLPRHYFLALRHYRKIIAFDVVLIILTLSSICFVPDSSVSKVIGFNLLIISIASYIFIYNKQAKFKFSKPEFKGVEFGFTNFLTGGITLSIIPIAKFFEGEELAGIISIFITITAISLLLPRAISLNQLPLLSASISDKVKSLNLTKVMVRDVRVVNVVTNLINVGIALVILYLYSPEQYYYKLGLVFLLLIIQSFINTLSLVDSNVIMAAEQSRTSLLINLKSSLIFFSVVITLIFYPTELSFTIVCLVLIFSSLYRLSMVNRESKRTLCL